VNGSERLEGREKEIILHGDTRLELLGQDENERKERIFLYFWIHTSFMTSTSASRATTPRSSDRRDAQSASATGTPGLRQDEGDNEESELVPMEGHATATTSVAAIDPESVKEKKEKNEQLVMELDKHDVDRGRYKGCPFKKADKVIVRLHYNYDE
jgi:hypothetical protein